jgi:hypothetical protein
VCNFYKDILLHNPKVTIKIREESLLPFPAWGTGNTDKSLLKLQKKKLVSPYLKNKLGMVAHTYNPSYSGGGGGGRKVSV